MSQKSITYQEQVSIFARQSALMNNKVALALITLIQVLLRIYLEHVVRHLEPYWFNLTRHLLTWFCNMTKSFISLTIQIW
jgi:hypothetical protein